MPLRQDALCAAADAILQFEGAAQQTPDLRATVGQVQVEPGASNVIPARVQLSVDIRHPDEKQLERSFAATLDTIQSRARERRVEVQWQQLQHSPAVKMDQTLSAHLSASTFELQGKAPVLISGAGHDGVMMAKVCPVAMLFVRCREGLSHHPDEYAAPADIEQAFAAFTEAVARYAEAFPA